MQKQQLSFMDELENNGRKEPLALIKTGDIEDSKITFDEILLGQTSIVAPEGAVLERRVNQDTSQEFLVKRFNHLVGTHSGDLRSVEIEIETLPSQGLTDYFDDKVLLTLHTLALDRDSHIYTTSISEICTTRDWPLNGEYIARVRKSLDKLVGTSIASDQFIDPDTNGSIKARVHLLPQYKRYRDEQRSITVKKDGIIYDEDIKYKKDFTIEINQFFFNSLKKQKIKLDIKVLNSFRNKTVEKLYRFLNTMFQLKSEIEINLTDLCDTLGVAVPKYISNIKRNIYVRYIKEIENNNIIKPFDIKKNYYKRAKIWRVKFERGEFYESLEDRWAMEPSCFNIFNYLHAELKFKKSEAHTLMEEFSKQDIQDNIDYLRLSLKLTPGVIRYPKAWLKKSLEHHWDNGPNLEILTELQNSKTALSTFQRSWEIRDFDPEEKTIYDYCINTFKVPENIVITWMKLHFHFDYIERLYKIFDQLKVDEQKADYLATMIRHRDARVWRMAVPGSEHESVSQAPQHKQAEYDSLFTNEIIIEPHAVAEKAPAALSPAPPTAATTSELIHQLQQLLGDDYGRLFAQAYAEVEQVFALAEIYNAETIRNATLTKMKNEYLQKPPSNDE